MQAGFDFHWPWFYCGARLLKQLRATSTDQASRPSRSCFNEIAKPASYFSAAPYETGCAFYLDGPDRDDLRTGGEKPRAVQFVGGRMKAQIDLDSDYTVELFFWNGLPNDNRAVTGYLFSLGPDGKENCPGDHLGIGGTAAEPDAAGRLFFYNGDEKGETISGGPIIQPKTWTHVRLVRRSESVAVYLNMAAEPISSGEVTATRPDGCRDVFIGGRSDNFANLEGRVAEVAVYP